MGTARASRTAVLVCRGRAVADGRAAVGRLGTDDLGGALARAGHDPAVPTTWVEEGVVPYLTADDVRATLAGLAARSAPGSLLVVQYQTRSWTATAGRQLSRLVLRLTRTADPLTAEPWRSLRRPRAMARLLSEHGLTPARTATC